jgi:hypothetical protein
MNPHSDEDWAILARVLPHIKASRRTVYNYLKSGKLTSRATRIKHGVRLYRISEMQQVFGAC